MAKKPRIVVEETEKGVRLRVDHAYSPEHAVYMLSQAISIIVTDGGKERELKEVEEDEPQSPMQELPDSTTGETEKDTLPSV